MNLKTCKDSSTHWKHTAYPTSTSIHRDTRESLPCFAPSARALAWLPKSLPWGRCEVRRGASTEPMVERDVTALRGREGETVAEVGVPSARGRDSRRGGCAERERHGQRCHCGCEATLGRSCITTCEWPSVGGGLKPYVTARVPDAGQMNTNYHLP